jgi:hypothetical protein
VLYSLKTKLTTLLIFSLFTALMVCGCASGGPRKGAYPTLKDTQRNVDWPMTAYRNAVAMGRITQGEQEQINSLFSQYQTAFQAAVQAANSNCEVTTPDNVKALANQLIGALGGL